MVSKKYKYIIVGLVMILIACLFGFSKRVYTFVIGEIGFLNAGVLGLFLIGIGIAGLVIFIKGILK